MSIGAYFTLHSEQRPSMTGQTPQARSPYLLSSLYYPFPMSSPNPNSAKDTNTTLLHSDFSLSLIPLALITQYFKKGMERSQPKGFYLSMRAEKPKKAKECNQWFGQDNSWFFQFPIQCFWQPLMLREHPRSSVIPGIFSSPLSTSLQTPIAEATLSSSS